MNRRVRVLGIFALLAAISFTLVFLGCPRVHYDYWRDLQVRGQLLDAATGEPLAQVPVLASWAPSSAVDDEYVTERRAEINEMRELLGRHGPEMALGSFAMRGANAAVTDADGRFATYLRVSWYYNSPGCSCSQGANLKDGIRIRSLLIEREGRAPVVMNAPTGTWTKHDWESEPWATHDLGVIRVPSEP